VDVGVQAGRQAQPRPRVHVASSTPRAARLRADINVKAIVKCLSVEAIARYMQAFGGEIHISAVFGDDLYILRGNSDRNDFQPFER
jgi:hypothetical protein